MTAGHLVPPQKLPPPRNLRGIGLLALFASDRYRGVRHFATAQP